MKFKRDRLKLGMRFYTFINEEEYRIVTLVKIDKNSGQFMDEETFEIETITEETLGKEFIMLTDYELWILCNFKTKKVIMDSLGYKSESFWLYNNHIIDFLNNMTYEPKLKIELVIYKFMRKSVFNKLINYIIKLNAPKFSISEDDIDDIWNEYFRYLNEYKLILDCSNRKDCPNMDDVIQNKAKIPDSILCEAEEILNTFILSYDPYELDDSVNMNNVNMKHFIIYTNDKYYLILYVVDSQKENAFTRRNLNEHMDVVDFMLK